MLTDKQKKVIKSFCLQNAIFYKGKAKPDAVIGKVIACVPELKQKIDDVRKEIAACVKAVNKMSIEQQRAQLAKIAPQLLEKVEKSKEPLSPLPKAVEGQFVTRFAPSPTGPLNIFHFLRAISMPWFYAKKYKGKFILRFDDTDPRKIEKKFYTWIIEDMKRCGIEPDSIIYESDYMADYYKYAEKMIKAGHAYICRCPAEKFREMKTKKINCPCQTDTNLKVWQDVLKGKFGEGEAVIRLKTSMAEPNPALRDPPLLRIIDARHPRVGKRYKLWPVYNFASVICDHEEGTTHIFRGKEHEHNTKIQAKIYQALGWPEPYVLNFGMIYLPGTKMHTRDIKAEIAAGRISGWDDPSLPTLRALLRRGYQPEAFKQLALQIGLTKTDIKLGWENLDGINRKIVDPVANRYFAVIDPIPIEIKIDVKEVKQNLHPDFPQRGYREIPVGKTIYIQKSDFESLKGKQFRLIGLCNIVLKEGIAIVKGKQIVKDMPKIQWVSEQNAKIKIIKPGHILTGLAEPDIAKCKVGDIVQLERIGFGRIEKIGKEVVFVWAHK
jgi:glutamyl-tRNA synthetase